jgi:hypothetical protein
VTLAEIRFGIERVAEPNRRAELNDWLTHKVRPMFDTIDSSFVRPLFSGSCGSNTASVPGC